MIQLQYKIKFRGKNIKSINLIKLNKNYFFSLNYSVNCLNISFQTVK